MLYLYLRPKNNILQYHQDRRYLHAFSASVEFNFIICPYDHLSLRKNRYLEKVLIDNLKMFSLTGLILFFSLERIIKRKGMFGELSILIQ